MKSSLIKYLLMFFIPVIVGYGTVEYLTRELPSSYRLIGDRLEENSEVIEVLVLGSSQMKDAINPEWIDRPLLNLASGDQHHNTDRKLYQGLKDQLLSLKTVILEVSHSHFELPHNYNDFWKYGIFSEYYGVNCFERNTWFKDRLLYLRNPHYFSSQLINHHITKEIEFGFNSYGFDTLQFHGRFKNLNYDEAQISKTRFKINREPNLKIFNNNSNYFLSFVEELIEDELEVIIVQPPMYKTYLPERNPGILKRRDSIIEVVKNRFPRIQIIDQETDTLTFNVRDFTNQSHLNPDGARKFSKLLNRSLNSSN